MKPTLRAVVGTTILAASAAWARGPAPGADPGTRPPQPSEWRAIPTGTTQPLLGVWGRSERDVYVVGHGLILHFDGAAWASAAVVGRLVAVWGSGRDVFAGGDEGLLLHSRDGGAWETVPTGTTGNIDGLWGTSAGDAFAVADSDGTILHLDGSRWAAMASGTAKPLAGVWGRSSSDVFAVGFEGTVLHYDGARWSAMASGSTQHLTGVWGTAGGEVFAVGFGGTILRYDGARWAPSPQDATTQFLTRVWGSSARDVFAVGAAGTILHYDGARWRAMASGTSEFLAAVWGSPGGVYVAGRNGTLLHRSCR
jgi:hypothetical protein